MVVDWSDAEVGNRKQEKRIEGEVWLFCKLNKNKYEMRKTDF